MLEISVQVLLRCVVVELGLHAIRNHQAYNDSILKHHNGRNYLVLHFLEVAWNYLQESINEIVILVKYSGINLKKGDLLHGRALAIERELITLRPWNPKSTV